MTVIPMPDLDLTALPDDEKRERVRADFRADPDLTGTAAAARYGMSAEWGRKQRRAAVRPGGTPAVRGTGTASVPSKPPAAQPTVPAPKPAARHAAHPKKATEAPRAVRAVTAAAVTLVAAVAAATSYSHMHHLAVEAGEADLVARVLPLSVDGLVVAATMALLSARRAVRPAGVLPWVALLLGLGASLAANVAAAEPTVVGRLVAAWPPVALALSFELLLRQTRGEP